MVCHYFSREEVADSIKDDCRHNPIDLKYWKSRIEPIKKNADINYGIDKGNQPVKEMDKLLVDNLFNSRRVANNQLNYTQENWQKPDKDLLGHA